MDKSRRSCDDPLGQVSWLGIRRPPSRDLSQWLLGHRLRQFLSRPSQWLVRCRFSRHSRKVPPTMGATSCFHRPEGATNIIMLQDLSNLASTHPATRFLESPVSRNSRRFSKVVSVDVVNRLTREESLVSRHQLVGKSQQSHEGVVLNHLVGEIPLLLVDVQAQISNVLGFQSFDNCVSVNQRAAACIDDHHTFQRMSSGWTGLRAPATAPLDISNISNLHTSYI